MIRTETVSANATNKALGTTDNHQNLYVYVSGSTLGSGSLSVSVRENGGGGDWISIDTAIPLGASYKYEIGTDLEVSYTLSGATSPDFTLLVSTGL